MSSLSLKVCNKLLNIAILYLKKEQRKSGQEEAFPRKSGQEEAFPVSTNNKQTSNS